MKLDLGHTPRKRSKIVKRARLAQNQTVRSFALRGICRWARGRAETDLLTLITIVVLAPLIIVTAFFALELFAGLPSLGRSNTDPTAVAAIIVIPAHNEEAVIDATVRRTLAAAQDIELLVIADNCTDRTAELARSAGATVLVRDDPNHRGKGFALAAARANLRDHPPDVVIVLDSDCSIDAQSLGALARQGGTRPCQAVNLLAPDLTAGPLVQLSSFAFMVKNLIRQRALQRLANRAHLTGTGMALPWPIFDEANLGGANIVEDLALGLELAKRAAPAMLVEDATVWSPAASTGGTLIQRRRWEGGFLATMLRTAPGALAHSLRRGDLRGLCGAIDLFIPPLALLAMLNAAALVLAFLLVVAGSAVWPLIVHVAAGILAAIAILLVWWNEGRRFASAATLLRLPFYVLWKLPMYLGLARRGAPKDWLRTGR
jgi:glycosyltransferase involved in cell wall biosynthesis